jgi:hypothetical protein
LLIVTRSKRWPNRRRTRNSAMDRRRPAQPLGSLHALVES